MTCDLKAAVPGEVEGTIRFTCGVKTHLDERMGAIE
jgi:hypothetical protein